MRFIIAFQIKRKSKLVRLIVNIARMFKIDLPKQIKLINDYQRVEIQAMKALLKKHDISSRELDDEMRSQLSLYARKIHPKLRSFVISIASPKTVVNKWWQKMKAKMYDSSDKQPEKKKVGRPKTYKEIKEKIIEFAREDCTASARNIADELTMLGLPVCRETVRLILKAAGIKPAPDRTKGMPWFEYLQKANIWQMDCTTTHIAVENPKGKMELICYHILLFIHVKTRKVVLGGIKENPDGQWVCNVIRSMLGFELEHARAIVMDRDPIFQPALRLFRQTGIETHLLPARSPNLNAYIERFHLTLKSECLSWLFLTSEVELRNAVVEFLYYYNHWRPHQSLGGLPPEPDERIIKAMNGELKGKIVTEERLNGIIRFRYREAA